MQAAGIVSRRARIPVALACPRLLRVGLGMVMFGYAVVAEPCLP